MAAVEARVEQRPPDAVGHLAAAVAAQPPLEWHLVQAVVRLPELAEGEEPREPGTAERAQRPEAEQVARPVEGVQLPVYEEAGADRREPQLAGQPELRGQTDQVAVGRRDRVVEAVDAVTAEVHAAREAARRRRALKHGDLRARLGEAEREHRAEDAAADDAYAGAHRRCATRAARSRA